MTVSDSDLIDFLIKKDSGSKSVRSTAISEMGKWVNDLMSNNLKKGGKKEISLLLVDEACFGKGVFHMSNWTELKKGMGNIDVGEIQITKKYGARSR